MDLVFGNQLALKEMCCFIYTNENVSGFLGQCLIVCSILCCG